MSKKKLLNEATVRRFMGLADLAPLSESFLDKTVNEEEETIDEIESYSDSDGEPDLAEAKEAVDESDEAVDEGGRANQARNLPQGEERRMKTSSAMRNESAAATHPTENLRMREEEDEDESEGDPSKTHPGELDYEGGDDLDALDMDAEIELDAPADGQAALADQAEVVMNQLAALINQAAGAEVVTVTSNTAAEEAELDMDAEVAVDDAEIADDEIDLGDLDVAGDEEEDLEDLEEDKAYTAKKEPEGADITKKAPVRGQRGTDSKTDPGEDAYTKKPKTHESKKRRTKARKKSTAVDRLVAEITSKVISRLNK